MLYEVITLGSNLLVIILSYVVSLLAVYALIKKPLACKAFTLKKVFGNKMAILFVLFVLLQVYLRITSYNVCYTKLLRESSGTEGHCRRGYRSIHHTLL